MIFIWLATRPIFEHFWKKCTFPFENPKTLVMHIAPNAGHTMLNDDRTMRNVGCNILDICQEPKGGYSLKVYRFASAPFIYEKFVWSRIALKLFLDKKSDKWPRWPPQNNYHFFFFEAFPNWRLKSTMRLYAMITNNSLKSGSDC